MSFLNQEVLKHYNHSKSKGNIPSTSASSGPVYVSSTRKKVSHVDDIELTNTKKRSRTSFTNVDYSKKTSAKTDIKKHVRRAPVYFLVALVLRLIFMDRGLIEYFQTQNKLTDMQYQLEQNKKEVQNIIQEIQLIKTSSAFQKKLARDHLGVIGPDEYLVLFAQESREISK